MLHAIRSEPGPSKDIAPHVPVSADLPSSADNQLTRDYSVIETEARQGAVSRKPDAAASHILIGLAYNPLEMTELEFYVRGFKTFAIVYTAYAWEIIEFCKQLG